MRDILEDFYLQYLKEYDFFSEAAHLCANQIESSLNNSGIRAIVTFRAKNPERLKEKLVQRDKKKKYKSFEEIYSDIVDLAGVRIALYFPADREEVQKLIESKFIVSSPIKKFPDKKAYKHPTYKKRFSGYWATHFRVNLKKDSISTSSKRYLDAMIEIQVASVLMHAWAEVEHDLVYKPFTGSLSEDEYAILDELNGLVLVGEIALERLQEAVNRRVGSSSRKFKNHYELSTFILDNIPETSSEVIIGRSDILFSFLEFVKMDKPTNIRKYLPNLEPADNNRPLVDQIVDLILIEKPDLTTIYKEVKEKFKNKDISHDDDANYAFVLKEFLNKWVLFENIAGRVSARLYQHDNNKKRVPFSIYRNRYKNLMLDNNLVQKIESLRLIRNRLVHGYDSPNLDLLSKGVRTLDEILNLLEDSEFVDNDIVESEKEKLQNRI